MLIDSVSVSNFKAFHGVHRLDLRPQTSFQGGNVHLIGALNGAGKTSLVQALLLAMYGHGAAGMPGLFTGGRDHRRRYEAWVADAWNRRARAHLEDEMRVGCTLRSTDTSYQLSRTYWFAGDGSVEDEELTLRVSDGAAQPVVLAGDEASERVVDLIPRNIANLAFFDGERVASIDRPDAGLWVVDALDRLLDLEPIKKLRTDVLRATREKRTQLADNTQRRAYESLQRKLGELEGHAHDQVVLCETLRANLLENRTALTRLDEQVASRLDGNEGVSASQVDNEIAALETRRAVLRDRLAKYLGDWLYLDLGHEFVRVVEDTAARAGDNLRLEQRRTDDETARSDLVRAILSDERTAELVRDTDRADFEGFLASKVESVRGKPLPTSPAWTTVFTVSELDEMAEAARSFLGREREGADDAIRDFLQVDSRLSELHALRGTLNNSEGLAEILRKRDELTATSTAQQEELTAAENALSDARREIASARSGVSRLDKALEGSSEAEAWLDEASRLEEALDTYTIELRRLALHALGEGVLKRLRPLLRKQKLVTSVTVDPASYEVLLRDAAGDPVRLPSAGEQQLAAIAFAAAMLDLAGDALPMIIDTPLARLDSAHRRNLVRNLLPTLGRQVIILSTDEEIDSTLFGELEPALAQTAVVEYNDETSTSQIIEGQYLMPATRPEADSG